MQDHLIRFLALAALQAGLAGTAIAAEGRYRLPKPSFDLAPAVVGVDNAKRQLTLIGGKADDGAEARGRRRTLTAYPVDAGLSLEITRLSSRPRPEGAPASDRYALKQLGLTGRMPLSGEVDIMLFGDAAYMSRTVEAVPAASRKGRILAARAGMGLAGTAWSLTAQYETVGSKQRHVPTHRLAEILGGAPLNREGLAVHMVAGGDSRLNLRLTGRAIGRPRQDLEITGAAGERRPEHMAELAIGFAF